MEVSCGCRCHRHDELEHVHTRDDSTGITDNLQTGRNTLPHTMATVAGLPLANSLMLNEPKSTDRGAEMPTQDELYQA